MSIVSLRKYMHNKVRFVMLLLAIVLAAGIAYMGFGNMGPSDDERNQPGMSGEMAKVGSESLSKAEFQKLYMQYLTRMAQQSGRGDDERSVSQFEQNLQPTEAESIRAQVLQQAMTELMIVQAAKSQGIKVSRREVKDAISEQVDNVINSKKAQLLAGSKDQSDKAFADILRKVMPGKTVDSLRADARKKMDAQKDQIEKMLYAQKLIAKLKSGIDTSDKAVRASFDTVTFRRITVDTKKRSEAQAEQIAKSLVDKLRQGADFAEIARQNSDDQMKAVGGLTSGIPISYVETELSNALAGMKPNDISDPVKTPEGVVILKLENKENKLPADFNDPKKQKQYRDNFAQMAMMKLQNDFFMKLKKSTKTEILDPEMKAFSMLTESEIPDSATLLKAASLYEEAAGKDEYGQARCFAMMSKIYLALSEPSISPKPEDQKKYRVESKKAVERALQATESMELRLMLAQFRIEDKEYDKAVDDLAYVAANGYNDPQAHSQMLALYKQMAAAGYSKANALVAEEVKWQADYDKQMKSQEADRQAFIEAQKKAQQSPKPAK